MAFLRSLILTLLIGFFITVPGQQSSYAEEGEELYKVTLLRAAPGKLSDLIDFLTRQKTDGYYDAIGENPPMIMRHSQGDHWDLLLLQPVGNYQAYFAREKDNAAYQYTLNSLSVFREELFAYGPAAETVTALYANNSFFHIEMFAALADQHDGLLQERIMENDYLVATGRAPNLIFVGDMGSDIDNFTIGFYPSIVEYASPAPVSEKEANQAAIDAGYEGRSSIGFYLRRFLAYHHDTLATKVE